MASQTPIHTSRAYNTPLALDDDVLHPHGLEPEGVQLRVRRNMKDSLEQTVGPMPVGSFLDHFLASRGSDAGRLLHTHSFKTVPSNASATIEVRDSLVEALNKGTKHKSRCPGFIFASSSHRPSHPHLPAYAFCYADDNYALAQQSDAELGYAEWFIDVHADPTDDYFLDPPSSSPSSPSHSFIHEIEDETRRRRRDRALGEHIGYATEVLARQHRLFVFSVAMFGSRARLLRWDRSGCVVTEAFDIREGPELFCEFLWRYSQSSDTAHGHDITVEVAHPEEEELFRAAIRAEVKLQLDIDGDALEHAVTEHYLPGHLYAVHVVSADGTTRRLLVSRPVISSLYFSGRGTRGYWALDTSTGRVVFLKDTWRSAYQRETEGETILGLAELGVRNVPEVVAHGDVTSRGRRFGHHTLADACASMSWVSPIRGQKPSPHARVHYRVVFATIGYGLERFRGTQELLHAGYDVFNAMTDAYRLDSRIHRDISLGNIVLTKEPGRDTRRGVLIDWEVSSKVDEKGESCDRQRMGTWLFMSGNLCLHPEAVPTLQDDMESLLWVVMFCSTRWLGHDLSDEWYSRIIYHLFEEAEPPRPGCDLVGGVGKFANRGIRGWSRRITWKEPMHTWLNTVMDYQYDPHASLADERDRWSDPAHLDAYWSNFLRETPLPSSDRVDRPYPDFSRYFSKPAPVRATMSLSPPPSSLGKRSSSDLDPSDAPRASKRLKVTPCRPVPPTAAPRAPPAPSPRRLRPRDANGRVACQNDKIPEPEAPPAAKKAARRVVLRKTEAKPTKSRRIR